MEVSENLSAGGDPTEPGPSASKTREKRAKLPTPSPVCPVAPGVTQHLHLPTSRSGPWSPSLSPACSGGLSVLRAVHLCLKVTESCLGQGPCPGRSQLLRGVKRGGLLPGASGDPRPLAVSELHSADLWGTGGCRGAGSCGRHSLNRVGIRPQAPWAAGLVPTEPALGGRFCAPAQSLQRRPPELTIGHIFLSKAHPGPPACLRPFWQDEVFKEQVSSLIL